MGRMLDAVADIAKIPNRNHIPTALVCAHGAAWSHYGGPYIGGGGGEG